MLDVHPPHAAVHTWKDFFIHVSTICVGLIIALCLEQTVEYFHRSHERHQLQADLREEAEGRIHMLEANEKSTAVQLAWADAFLQAALKATPLSGMVTFVVPLQPSVLQSIKPESSVWPAAKASGSVAVLSRPEIEAWDRVDFDANLAEHYSQIANENQVVLMGIAAHLGITLYPGATIRVNAEGRDELTRALGLLIANAREFYFQDARQIGVADAVLHGAMTPQDAAPYIAKAIKAMPR